MLGLGFKASRGQLFQTLALALALRVSKKSIVSIPLEQLMFQYITFVKELQKLKSAKEMMR